MLLWRIGRRRAAQTREDEHRRRRVPGHRLGRPLYRSGAGPVHRPGPARDDRAHAASLDEAGAGLEELADLDQGSTQDFPIQGYAVTAAWAKKYPNTLKAFTTALSQGQEIADTDRAAVESAIEQYLHIQKEAAAFISLPTFPLGVDPVRLQRVVSTMTRFGLLPQGTTFNISGMIIGG
jgi:hypothetical protein